MIVRFSPCGRYRFVLERRLTPMMPGPTCNFIMLNPSTADEYLDDPTIRRCKRFARSWGYSDLIVTNLSPLRATDSAELRAAGPEPEEIVQENLQELMRCADLADRVVAAWGTHGVWEGRDRTALQTLQPWGTKLFCLRLTKEGHPQHPLYVKADTEPVRFEL